MKHENRKIKNTDPKQYFQVCKILDKLQSESDIKAVKDFIESISASNQECIRLLENIYSYSKSIKQA